MASVLTSVFLSVLLAYASAGSPCALLQSRDEDFALLQIPRRSSNEDDSALRAHDVYTIALADGGDLRSKRTASHYISVAHADNSTTRSGGEFGSSKEPTILGLFRTDLPDVGPPLWARLTCVLLLAVLMFMIFAGLLTLAVFTMKSGKSTLHKEVVSRRDIQESQSQSQSTGSFAGYTNSDEEVVSSCSWHTKESSPESIGAYLKRTLRFETILDVLPTTLDIAMIEPDSQERPLNHEMVRRFIAEDFDLRPWVPSHSRVAVALPNGRDCALVTLACIATHSCVPMSPDSLEKDLVDSFAWLGCVALLCLEGSDADVAATGAGIARIHVVPGLEGQPTLTSPIGGQTTPSISGPPHRSLRHSVVLTIMTSGTTGQKKAAVHTLDSVVVGGFCIARSWKLTREDVGLNMMPMFHIGGIARNLFAAMLSGGSVCFAPGFDAERFWTLATAHKVTWYYGSPTIHEEILHASGTTRAGSGSCLRFVANAAGHLQHALAQRMAREFQCAILPCYGCSEAMPISSPPPDYQLSKPGSSGVPCGPEILIADGDGGVLEPGETGHILVRGPPCMQGYEGNLQPTTVMLGWFDTGDIGHLDLDGWLFITGRSKEVINRGGEIIAPTEVEEALSDFSGIREAAAFAAPHDLMQEVVGLAVVTSGRRPSLRSLQRHLAGKLHPSSIPQIVVFLDELPRGNTGKVIRLKLAERCGLPILQESMSLLDRHWEQGESSPCSRTPCARHDEIPCRPVRLDLKKVISQSLASGHCLSGKANCVRARGQSYLAVHVTFRQPFTRFLAQTLMQALEENTDLHDYEVPSLVVPMEEHWEHDPSRQCWRGEEFIAPSGNWEERVARIWQEHLASASDGEFWLSACADFFEAGGSSLLAGRTIAQLRSQYGVALRVQDAFEHRTVQAMARVCEQRAPVQVALPASHAKLAHLHKQSLKPNHLPRFGGVLVQHIPVLLLIPAKLMIRLLCYIGMYTSTHRFFATLPDQGDMRVLVIAVRIMIAIGLTRIVVQLIFPCITIISKWVIIGRYTAGEYPMWSNMYYRWWLVEKTIGLFGPGLFEWNRAFMILYYKAMGAKIGQRASISQKARLAEFDLVTIGDDAIVGSVSTVRGFAVCRGGFHLQPVRVGCGSEVCLQSIVAPGHSIADGAHVPPLSSSHSVSTAPAPRGRYDPSFCQEPCLALKLFIGYPLVVLQSLLMYAPSAYMIFVMVTTVGARTPRTNAQDVLAYFADPQRLGILLAMSYVRSTVEPMIGLAFAIITKRLVLGRFKPGRQVGQWPAFQRYMLPWLLGRSTDSGDGAEDLVATVTDLFGTHFMVTGWILRALGAKVGDRIYWPGSGLQIVEYDLLEIGNDVVFGSRSLISFRSGEEVKPIRIGAGAMVADRCVLLPGSSLGTNCMLGSGGLCPEDMDLPANSTWVGSEGGEPVQLHMPVNSVSTIKPFGRAFYGREAPYFVLPVVAHTLNSLIWAPLVYHETKVRVILMLLFVHRYGAQWLHSADFRYTVGNLFLISILVQGLLSLMLLAACVGLQELIIGTRTPGNCSWDKSSYCQRWLLHRRVRRSVQSTLDLLGGTPMLNSFFRASGAQIGVGTCLYPTGATPMMTEPELVTIGDGACIDDCSLVAHSNTHGEMELRKVVIGSMTTARSRTRVLSGGAMDDNTELREHTLVLPGDCVPSGEVWQGWPARSRWPLAVMPEV